MKKDLKNIKKAALEIGQLLAADEILCNLLYIDTPNALQQTGHSYSLNDMINDKYITVYPPVETTIKDIERNSFLVILLDNINLRVTDNNIRASFTIYTTTDSDHILLLENKNRLLEMCDRIIQVLDQAKLSSAGAIEIGSVSHVMLSEFRAGYRISLNITDQTNRKAEI